MSRNQAKKLSPSQEPSPRYADDGEHKLSLSLEAAAPWGNALLERLRNDGAELTHLRAIGADRWLLQVGLPNDLRNLYGIAPAVLLLAAADEVRGEDLQAAQEELQRKKYDLDSDLLVVVDGHLGLEDRLNWVYQLWGQWVPWSPVDGEFLPLAQQFRRYLPAYDVFEKRDPVRGRQVIGRRHLVADISKRLRRGQSMGIFGLRKIGKTTLVRAVTDKLDPITKLPSLPIRSSRKEYGDARTLVIWLDVQDLCARTLESLAGQLARSLQERLVLESIDVPPPTPGETTVEYLNCLLETGLRQISLPICIVFDEYDLLFESEAGEPAIPQIDQLFRILRAHAQSTKRLAFVVVGRDSEFFDQPEISGRPNPMLNWMVPRWLGPMEPADADELLRRLGRRVGLDVGEQTARLARHWTGGHPLLHRQFGSALLERTGRRGQNHDHIPTDPFCEEALDSFLDRDALLTTCREVYFLLTTHYPEAFLALRELVQAPPQEGAGVVKTIGGWHQPAIRILRRFGLLAGEPEAPLVPEYVRWYGLTFAPQAHPKAA